MSRVVIVGGGAAGLELASLLGRSVNAQDEIILVEGETHHYWKPRFHEIAAGTFDNDLDTLCYFSHGAKNGYRHYQARLTDINREEKQLIVYKPNGETDTLAYDYLVIAVGAISNDFATKGAQEHCLFLDTPQQARDSWQQISSLLRSGGQRTINIVGAGATGLELAAELAKVSGNLARNPQAAQLTINLIEAADRVLPNGPLKMSEQALLRLKKFKVNVMLNTRIASVDQQGMTTSEGLNLDADVQFWAAGIKAPDWLKNIGGLESNSANQLMVQQTLASTLDSHIFSLGDCAAIPQADGSMVPPKAQAANRAAVHLAKSLKGLMQGKELTPFVYKDGGMVVAIGHDYAISTMMNDRLILKGRLVRRLYDTIFRLHQKTVSGLFTMSRLIIAKRLKCIFQPN
ncbi:NAD(P)/FAD-dependent oxidoreductase [Shewanella sp. D64]|uniref:NAD(P)/FAD-dependent oxidoreductase n=1 Tax=unclassified Shewanella TaxID=196818 RepID=UPI0022BA452F|nr:MULTISPECIES: NAD(P)/FAD-dependent oxidoreductase [unclassified Shewanella]MEC4725487.1 NAD(P)/FAD-dependent oxidoreductase [Shewanella sp. D64]MEC4738694.1 NAD(P)/FAD-dependent oxidoreductase [Shewanella sp. E94]WBJ94990.1 NAD(P)/FAD-dependent oxidoreductase [Shewanella sp. MTB7]